MADELVLHAEPRESRGRSEAKKIRASGRLPGVIYGTGIAPRALAVDRHDFIRALHAHGAHPLVTIKVGSDEHLALVKEVQVDAVRQEALHVDFLRVEADKPVHTQVALHLIGEPAGVKLAGGVLEVQLRTLDIEALPRSIPEFIELDVSDMNVGDVIRVADITAPAGATILTDPEETVATVSASRTEAAAAAAAAGVEEAAEGEEGEKKAEEGGEESS